MLPFSPRTLQTDGGPIRPRGGLVSAYPVNPAQAPYAQDPYAQNSYAQNSYAQAPYAASEAGRAPSVMTAQQISEPGSGSVLHSPVGHDQHHYSHSPEPSFIQPTIVSSDERDPYGSSSLLHDPYGSGSLRHQQSSAEVNTIRHPDSASPTSPRPSYLHSNDQGSNYHPGDGSYYHPEGSVNGSASPERQSQRLSVGSPGKGGKSGHRSPIHEIIEDIQQHFMMHARKNMAWKPNGPKDVSGMQNLLVLFAQFDAWTLKYARSVSKWKIEPTQYTPFFCHDNCLFHRDMNQMADPGAGISRTKGGVPSGGAKLGADDIQNGEILTIKS